jgi:hypothetical protein
MDSKTPTWTRPDDLRPRGRRLMPYAFGAIAIGLSLTTGLLLAEKTAATTIVPVVSPVHVTVAAPPPATASVTAAIPVPSAPATATVTAAAPVPVEAPAPITYRPSSPKIQPECVGLVTADAADPVCAWENGFPAITPDGSQIVEHQIPDDGGRGNPGLEIIFTDVATSKVVHKVTVLSPDEIEYDKPIDDKLRAKIRRRAAAAQKLIDAKKFHSMTWLGTHSAMSDSADLPEDRSGIHADFSGATMRLLDPTTKTELWRHYFTAPSPFGTPDPDKECNSWNLANLSTWWDPHARVVFGRLLFHHGGCMCGSSSIMQAFRL